MHQIARYDKNALSATKVKCQTWFLKVFKSKDRNSAKNQIWTWLAQQHFKSKGHNYAKIKTHYQASLYCNYVANKQFNITFNNKDSWCK